MSYGYIYLIRDHFTSKVYVGQHLNRNDDYFGSGIIIQKIIKKRKHHLSKIILGYCDTKEELNEAEKICIEFFHSNDRRYGYNLSSGGFGGDLISNHPRNKEIRQNLSIKNKGKIISFSTRIKISNSLKGFKHSDSSKNKMSVAKTGKLGHKHSNETKRKISIAKKGNKATLGFKFSEESKLKMSIKAKLRSQGSNNNKFRHDLDVNKIIEMRHDGFLIKEIAEFFNCSCTAIRNRLKQEG